MSLQPWIQDYVIGVAEQFGADYFNAPPHPKWKTVQIIEVLVPDHMSFQLRLMCVLHQQKVPLPWRRGAGHECMGSCLRLVEIHNGQVYARCCRRISEVSTKDEPGSNLWGAHSTKTFSGQTVDTAPNWHHSYQGLQVVLWACCCARKQDDAEFYSSSGMRKREAQWEF